jgi:hypothetical protein
MDKNTVKYIFITHDKLSQQGWSTKRYQQASKWKRENGVAEIYDVERELVCVDGGWLIINCMRGLEAGGGG